MALGGKVDTPFLLMELYAEVSPAEALGEVRKERMLDSKGRRFRNTYGDGVLAPRA